MTTQNLGQGPRQSTFTIETGDGYRLEVSVKGFVDTDAETFASEILAIASHAFNDTFSGDFEEHVVDMLDHKFRARLEAEGKPSEYDQGWAAGRQAALLEVEQDADPERKADEGMIGKVLEVTATDGAHGFPVGTKVTVVAVEDEDGDPETGLLATTLEQDYHSSEDEWMEAWSHGVTAWVGTENTKPWVDTDDES